MKQSSQHRNGVGSCGFALVISLWVHASLIVGLPGNRLAAQDSDRTALDEFRHGHFEKAYQLWTAELKGADAAADAKLRLTLSIRTATALQEMGRYEQMRELLKKVEESEMRHQTLSVVDTAQLWNAMGVAYTWTRESDKAGEKLKAALDIAGGDGVSPQLRISVLINFGNLYASEGESAKAFKMYEDAAHMAVEIKDETMAARASVNAAAMAVEADDASAERWLIAATGWCRKLNPSAEKVNLLMKLALAHVPQIEGRMVVASEQSVRFAFELYGEAIDEARRLGNRRLECSAVGRLAMLYESARQPRDASKLIARARFLAQEVSAPDLLYRWEWVTGRLLSAQPGREADAIEMYRRAKTTLDTIRPDLVKGYGNSPSRASFRQQNGPLYFELADLLLRRAANVQQASQLPDDAEVLRPLLEDARQTVEELKARELSDYFRSDCIEVLQKNVKEIDDIATGTAVIYLIPLSDRIEILVSLPGKRMIRQRVEDVELQKLTREVNEFRRRLVDRRSYDYREQSQRLYHWLIHPIRKRLEQEKTNTLVFVPDGVLCTIPMAALSEDGERFLIQDFAIAVTPGLTLMNPEAFSKTKARILIGSLSESVIVDEVSYQPLPYTNDEIAGVRKVFEMGESLQDKAFVAKNIKREMENQSFTIVHLATHGVFSGSAEKSFLVAYNDKLGLDGLEKLIAPSQFSETPVELLTLSACQTATGDERAALGLAGIAIKSGARSAVATLWHVDDEAAAELIQEFYRQLRQAIEDETLESPDQQRPPIKAAALRAAQLKLITHPDRRFRHPFKWSPFLLIGNWL